MIQIDNIHPFAFSLARRETHRVNQMASALQSVLPLILADTSEDSRLRAEVHY